MQNEFGTSSVFNPVPFDSRDEQYKKPFGAVSTREIITFNFPVDANMHVDGVALFLRRNQHSIKYPLTKVETKDGYDLFTVDILVDREGTYFYRFEIYQYGNCLYCGKNPGTSKAIIGEFLPEWQLSIYESKYKTADFIKGGVVYQIFVDRFNKVGETSKPEYGVTKKWNEDVTIVDPDGVYRANDFYCGNFKGITAKLDYLESLGVTCLYLSPIFKSNSNHRYDTGDYLTIDPILGTEADFKELVDKAKKKGISIVLDGVFNHTGADSIYFNKFGHFDSLGAYQSKESPYYDWYTFYDYPDEYMCWWGITVVPTIARDAVGYRNLICGKDGVIDKWMKFGIKGWRLDVVDELSSSFVEEIRTTIKSKDKDALILGEVWEDASTKESYGEERQYFYGEQLDGVMNYVYKAAILEFLMNSDAYKFKESIETIMENYPLDSLNTCFTLIDSHDTFRAINVLANVNVDNTDKQYRKNYMLSYSEYNQGREKLKLASAIQFFLPGVPSIYYGDEIGMQGFEDPLNRRPFTWEHIDLDLLDHYKMLGEIRRNYRKAFTTRAVINAVNYDEIEIVRDGVTLQVNVKEGTFNITTKKVKNGK